MKREKREERIEQINFYEKKIADMKNEGKTYEEVLAMIKLIDLPIKTKLICITKNLYPIPKSEKGNSELNSKYDARRKEIVKFAEENPDMTLNEIGCHFGVTRERIRQILKKNSISCRERGLERVKNYHVDIIAKLHEIVEKEECGLTIAAKKHNLPISKNIREAYYKVYGKPQFKKKYDILKMLRETNFTCAYIAKINQTNINYVSRLNREYNVRVSPRKGN